VGSLADRADSAHDIDEPLAVVLVVPAMMPQYPEPTGRTPHLGGKLRERD
jgi:hypothetical protein